MKVKKALELARHVAVQIQSNGNYEAYQAILLCIAALERHKDRDYRGYAAMTDKLPGED